MAERASGAVTPRSEDPMAADRRTLVMGVVNVTPDSFSDGGLHDDPLAAVRHAEHLLAQGAEPVRRKLNR